MIQVLKTFFYDSNRPLFSSGVEHLEVEHHSVEVSIYKMIWQYIINFYSVYGNTIGMFVVPANCIVNSSRWVSYPAFQQLT